MRAQPNQRHGARPTDAAADGCRNHALPPAQLATLALLSYAARPHPARCMPQLLPPLSPHPHPRPHSTAQPSRCLLNNAARSRKAACLPAS
jgi:hypothetical protein